MTERVTVAVDGGPASDAALAWAEDRAATTPLHLEITTVVQSALAPTPEIAEEYRQHAERVVAIARLRAAAQVPGLAITTEVLEGQPCDQLIRRSPHADLLVIGTNKTSPIVGILHGTLALKIAGQAQCTTVVVPVNWKPSTGPVVVGWTNDLTSDAALDFGAREAARTGRELSIVHTWSAAVPSDAPAAPLVVEEVMGASQQLLAGAASRIRAAYPSLAVTEIMHAGSAAVSIVRAAEGASLVVVGSRGRGAIAGFFLGSVSHDVLQNMPAPVAVVPRKEEPIDVYPDLVEEAV